MVSSTAQSTAWETAQRWVLAAEGGAVSHPSDRGGRTNIGITGSSLAEAIRQGLIPDGTRVEDLTAADALAIYRALYWAPMLADELPAPLAVAAFDGAVLHGVQRATTDLQVAVRVDADGVMGPRTLAAVEHEAGRPAGLGEVLVRFLTQRALRCHRIAASDHTQAAFHAGWLARLFRLHAIALRLREDA